MTSYALPFSPDGRTHESFTVPAGKVVYLTRGPQVSTGTATVQDLIALTDYVLQEGVTIMRTNIQAGAQVTLCFLARSNQNINLVLAEVISPRE